MRRCLLAFIACAVLCPTPSVLAQSADSSGPDCVATESLSAGYCFGSMEVSAPGRSSTGRGRATSHSDREWVAYPGAIDSSGDAPCTRSWYFDADVLAQAPTPDVIDAGQAWETARYPACAGRSGQQLDPEVYAIRFWHEIPLPKPQPHIAPGWMITGKYAYLETNGERSHTYTSDTPLGPLVLKAKGRYYVDWGDGTKDGPYDFEGGPWPDGKITHTYIDVGTYDVVVTEEWSSTWSIGQFGGTLGGLRTEGTIPDFRVEQIQVVVGR